MENKELKDKIKFKIAMSEIDDEEKANMNKFKNGIMSKIAVVACFVLLIGGATFADEISEKVYDIYAFRKQYNIETKLPEEVVNNPEKLEEVLNNKNSIIKWDERAADVVESNNLKIDITSIGMDDYYMIFNAEIEYPEEVLEKMALEDIWNVRFPDLVIKDENDNILFCMEENKLKEIFGTDDLEAIKNNTKYCISKVRDHRSEYNSNTKFEYTLNTKLPSIYPKSKNLIFEFNKIALDPVEASIGSGDKHYLNQDQALTVIGDYRVEIDVPSKYSEREDAIAYKLVESDSNPKNELLYCYYKDDVMHINFNLETEDRSGPWGSAKLDDMLNELDIDPAVKNYVQHNISNSLEFRELEAKKDEVYRIEDYYIENSNGERSKPPYLLKLVRR